MQELVPAQMMVQALVLYARWGNGATKRIQAHRRRTKFVFHQVRLRVFRILSLLSLLSVSNIVSLLS